MQIIEGESFYWINKNGLTKDKFEWQDEYYTASVSESILNKIRTYIKNQEEHHSKKTFQDEVDEFISSNGFEKFPSI